MSHLSDSIHHHKIESFPFEFGRYAIKPINKDNHGPLEIDER